LVKDKKKNDSVKLAGVGPCRAGWGRRRDSQDRPTKQARQTPVQQKIRRHRDAFE
jgi:hypothetical protein